MSLDKLLYLQGVGASFINYSGELTVQSSADRVQILGCMLGQLKQPLFDLTQTTPEDFVDRNAKAIEARIEQLDAKPWQRALPIFQHTNLKEPCITLFFPQGDERLLTLELITESGEQYQWPINREALIRTGDYYWAGTTFYRFDMHLSDYLNDTAHPDMGYHTLKLRLTNRESGEYQQVSGTILFSPSRAFQLTTIDSHKPWGVSVQLYSLRSDAQWGIGDFGDLSRLVGWLSQFGCDFIQLNPLHALGLKGADDEHISPYSPSDRRRINPLYIDIDTVNEALSIEEWLASQHDVRCQLNEGDWLDYGALSTFKYQIFTRLYQVFYQEHYLKQDDRFNDFKQFVDGEGQALVAFCQHEADGFDESQQQSLLREPLLHQYLQFVAHQQLLACQRQAKDAGMSVGLIGDLAVGVRGDGVEVKHDGTLFCQRASIGAPPDDFSSKGQNWGLTPLDPIAMRQDGFNYFTQLVRANMRYYGALRVDHVMAMLRLWWWPMNTEQAGGCYVYYPLDELMAIIRTESIKAQCAVIGEDLGIVPPEINAQLSESGIYSNELFYFCKDAQGFKAPNLHKPHSLMMLANHDVPPLAAWWSKSDLHLMRQLGLIDSDEQLKQAIEARDAERQKLLVMLNQTVGFDGDFSSDYLWVLEAWIKSAAQSQSALFSVQLMDLFSEHYSVNIPGTWREYANWQRRIPYTLEVLQQTPSVNKLIEDIQQIRSADIATLEVAD
ncbi:4-alpha-glucanotransferase [Shewanella psychrotolerans]|uniref:4-alpha-glucanotransferase n=1 Tax=Shewanella psychrotolerans TaxID=2864206 RepID=UPI001C65F307|nr:4-alpha-glucanotransferase [Shewanella psychrotolerans]QYK02338.1 4-alpha-glucanotransferase [Shewanella psychrotolerans]